MSTIKEKFEIDENYLNHKLKLHTEYSKLDYKCEKCNIIIYFYEGHYYDVDFRYEEDGDVDMPSELTCEDHIIKNIIE